MLRMLQVGSREHRVGNYFVKPPTNIARRMGDEEEKLKHGNDAWWAEKIKISPI